jgi:hypothetical protein
MSLADELERLRELRASGALTQDEYERAKRVLLAPAPEGEPTPETELAAVDWGDVAAQPSSGRGPARRVEITGRDVWKALEAGLVGGMFVGMAVSFAADRGTFWPTTIAAALVGAVVWTGLALGVKATAAARGTGTALAGSLLRLLWGAVIVCYLAAVLFLVYRMVQLEWQKKQPAPPPTYIPPATVH